MEHYYALIMAGGGGTRLWPLSRRDTPKQMLSLVDEYSMFKVSVERLKPLFPPERIYVVTGQRYAAAMQEEAPEIPSTNFVIEPSGRDTAAAAGLGIAVIHKRDPQATVAILTADHHIAKTDHFLDVLSAAHAVAQDEFIVTLGISPSYPATGFGYIQQGRKLRDEQDFAVYEALRFKEKPNVVTATTFLADGNYTWNSGMFIWKTQTALAEFERQQQRAHFVLNELIPAVDTVQFQHKLEILWTEMPRMPIDIAIMENATNIAVIPIDIGWNDIGSWAALYDILDLDQFGNSLKSKSVDHITLDTRNTLVFNDRLTVTIGVEDLIIVDSGDALLICHKDRAQDVREVVKHLRANQQNRYL